MSKPPNLLGWQLIKGISHKNVIDGRETMKIDTGVANSACSAISDRATFLVAPT